MSILYVGFKSNTSPMWAIQKLTELGLSENKGCWLKSNMEFMLTTSRIGFNAQVQVSEEKEIFISRAIRMISPQVVSVSIQRA